MRLRQKLIAAAMPALAILAALLIVAVMIAGVGESPAEAYRILAQGAVGDWRSLTDTLVKTVPLIFTGLSFAFAAKCNIWNIGAEGQLYMGAVASTAGGVYCTGLPALLHLPLALLAGALAGGLWASIPAWLKVRFKINEVVSTIMLNYTAILIVSALVYGPMIEDPFKSPQTCKILPTARLPVLFEGTKLHAGILLALLACVLYHLIFRHMLFGYRVSAVGKNREAARFSGISVERSICMSMIIAGVFGGLAGAIEMLGTNGLLIIGFSPEYGSDGIAVALLGQLEAVGIFLSAFLLGALRLGATALQRKTDIPQQMITIMQGIIVLFVIAGSAIGRILQNRAAKKEVK